MARVGRDLNVEQAVQFLLHPKVRTATLSAKLMFLRRKGLDDKEMARALSRAHPELSSIALHLVEGDSSSPALYTTSQGNWTWKSICYIASGCSAFVLAIGFICQKLRQHYGGSKPVRNSEPQHQQQLLEAMHLLQMELQQLRRSFKEQSHATKKSLSTILLALRALRTLPISGNGESVQSTVSPSMDGSGVLVSSPLGAGTENLDLSMASLSNLDQEEALSATNNLLLLLTSIVADPTNESLWTITATDSVADNILYAIGFHDIDSASGVGLTKSLYCSMATPESLRLVKQAISRLEALRTSLIFE